MGRGSSTRPAYSTPTATGTLSAAASSSCPRADASPPARSRELFTELAKDARGEEPSQLTGSGGRQRRHVNPADRALLELQRATQSHQSGRQLPEAGLVANNGNVMPAMLLAQLVDDGIVRAPWCERLHVHNGRRVAKDGS